MGRQDFLPSLPLSSFLPAESGKNPAELLPVFGGAHSFLCGLSHGRRDTHFETKTHLRRPKSALEYFISVGLVSARERVRSLDPPTRWQPSDAQLQTNGRHFSNSREPQPLPEFLG